MPDLTLTTALQTIVALGLLNVWVLRVSSVTSYRGGDARSLREEFAVYGLPTWFFYLVGVLKVGSALALVIGLWVPAFTAPAAAVILVLMLGALAMHAKVRDPLRKSLPALLVLVMSAIVFA